MVDCVCLVIEEFGEGEEFGKGGFFHVPELVFVLPGTLWH
jgi:hypothetical protein